jgi:trigger factor
MSDATLDTASDSATATLELEVAVDRPNACSRVLRISVPAAEVDRRLEEAMKGVAREAVLPGFRRGKAPRALLEKRLGADVLRDTGDRLLGEAVSEAIRREGLKPLSDPELANSAEKPQLRRGEAFTVAVEVEVMPDFETPSFENFAIRKPVGEIEESLVEREVDRQRRWYGNPERIIGPFETQDRMIGRAVVFRDGAAEPFFQTDEALTVVPSADEPSGAFLGIVVEGLHGLLAGRSVGETVTIEAVGPDGHEIPEVRGAKLRMTYEIRDAERIHRATEEEVAAGIGLPGAEQLRPQIRLLLEERQRSEQRAAMREQVAEKLMNGLEIELPEKISQRQVSMLLERQRAELLGRGFDSETIEMELAKSRLSSERDVRDRLKLSFALARIADELGVTVSEGDVEGRIAQMARRRGERPEQLRNELAQSGRLGSLAIDLREQRVLDRIIDRAEVSEIPIAEWNAQMQAKREAAGRA